MTTTYTLAPNPKWYIADLTGKPLGAGKMYTYSSLNKTVQKFVYQDPNGQFPWSDPILFDENGSQGPFYWKFDSTAPTDLYYIEVYDVNNVLQWTIDNFDGTTGSGGGGGTITTAIDLKNYISNNVMWRNFGASANPIASTAFKIAAGPHAGFAQTPSNYGPDIWFIKTNTNATDQLQFKNFTPVGIAPLTGDETPLQYLNYSCTAVGAGGETFKYVQFPITRSVQNLSNMTMTYSIWARCNSGNANLALYFAQFYGDGTATATNRATFVTIPLTNAWARYTGNIVVPNASGSTLGACGNDGLFLQVQYPLNNLTDIDFCKPCLFLGNTTPTITYDTYDQIDAIINAPRTGYITSGYDLVAPFGYLLMDDLTIGSASSGATSNGGRGAATDCFPLYNWLWTNVSQPSGNTLCPVSAGLGASAVADFTANKTITLQAVLGRALSSAGAGSGLTARALGSIIGSETHTMTIAEMPSHNHGLIINDLNSGAAGNASVGDNGTHLHDYSAKNYIQNEGGGTAFTIMQPASFLNFFIKL